MANLVSSQCVRFGRIVSTPQIICSPEEYKTVKANFDKIVEIIGMNMDFFEKAELYDDAWKLYDKLCDIEVIESDPREEAE